MLSIINNYQISKTRLKGSGILYNSKIIDKNGGNDKIPYSILFSSNRLSILKCFNPNTNKSVNNIKKNWAKKITISLVC